MTKETKTCQYCGIKRYWWEHGRRYAYRTTSLVFMDQEITVCDPCTIFLNTFNEQIRAGCLVTAEKVLKEYSLVREKHLKEARRYRREQSNRNS